MFNGQTGTVIDTAPYEPALGDIKSWGGNGKSDHRPGRHLACIAYVDGKRPSAVFGRGYYPGRKWNIPGRTAIAAWDLVDGKLVKRWKFDTLGKKELKGYLPFPAAGGIQRRYTRSDFLPWLCARQKRGTKALRGRNPLRRHGRG